MTPSSLTRSRARLRAFLLLALFAIAALASVPELFAHDKGEGSLTVAFLDVGQGDAIFVRSPTGVELLIDADPDASVLRELPLHMDFTDRSLDAVLLTHEDKDHVGGLPDIFERYSVDTFIRTENQGDSEEADTIDEYAAAVEHLIYARRGMIFDLGGGATLEILFPAGDPRELESNTSSIVARLVYGETEFLFTGDSPSSIESYLVSQGKEGLKSDVLKAGHHGSRTSTSPEFVAAVSPQYAVISAGPDNRYGHPHEEVVATLEEAGVKILNTAEKGAIIFKTDGRVLDYID